MAIAPLGWMAERQAVVHKLMVVFRVPPPEADFEAHWSDEFVPAAEKMPGLRRVTVSRVLGSPVGGSEFYLLHEFFFDDLPAVKAAMASPQGQQAGGALMSFARPFVSLAFAEHLEEERKAPRA
jgi:uncharacterized protein (TIGR02118 family)